MQSAYDYGSTGAGSGSLSGSGSEQTKAGDYWDISKLKRAYTDYLGSKREEIEEAKDARRYYHGAQWTEAQLKVLRERKQPVTTKNRIARKIDGVVGLLERLRQDPKAFPRTPKHDDGADLATAVIRYALDQQEWSNKSAEVGTDCAIEGIGGVEIGLTEGDHGDTEIDILVVEPDSYFYDPRSYRPDFSDALFMGVGKWVDLDIAREMFPDKSEELEQSVELGTDLSSNPDREKYWFDSDRRRIRLVETWYRHRGEWCYCIHTGALKLYEGTSWLVDEKGATFCKYVMFSGNVDHDGDRYGFVRNLKSSQDEINMRTSKGLHMINSRRLIVTHGAVDDIEKTRKEWARPDGVVVVNPGGEAKAEDQTADLAGQLKFLEDAKSEIENFGPNPALIGQGVENKSGRAIALLQQAGIAELGPFILSNKSWKIRVYRAVFNALKRAWTAERWIRVTDDEGLAQFIQINGLGIDANTGFPTIINALGSLDVDIIIDEGPDTINMMADTYDALLALAQSGAQVPPAVLIELSQHIDSRTKKKVLSMIERAGQPDPQKEQLALKDALAEIIRKEAAADKDRSAAFKNIADAGASTAEALAPPEPPTGGMQQQAQPMQPAQPMEQPPQPDMRMMEQLVAQQQGAMPSPF